MILNGKWKVETIAELGPVADGSQLTLEFDGDRVFGKGINSFRGSFDEKSYFGPMASTMMAGPPELMDQEHAFLTLLERVDGYSVEQVRLTVGGKTAIILTREGTEDE